MGTNGDILEFEIKKLNKKVTNGDKRGQIGI